MPLAAVWRRDYRGGAKAEERRPTYKALAIVYVRAMVAWTRVVVVVVVSNGQD